MNKLIQELQRLFGLPGQEEILAQPVRQTLERQGGARLQLRNATGAAKTLVVGMQRAADWDAVAALYEGVQAEWEWPAPAVSVSPDAGFQVWFSLASAIPADQAARLLVAMRECFFPELPASRVALLPSADAAEVGVVPAFHAGSGKWSAFIDPAMGSMFADETGLDVAPNPDRQAEMLAAVQHVKAEDLRRVLAQLDQQAGHAPAPAPGTMNASASRAPAAPENGQPLSGFADPKAFLLAVMNDPAAGMADRIRAAEALLPYFETPRSVS